MGKWLLGFVGLYRSFQKTHLNLLERLVQANPTHTFDVAVNTDFGCVNREKHGNNVTCSTYADRDDLVADLHNCYGKLGTVVDVMFYENTNRSIGGTEIFRERIRQLFNKHEANYDHFLFIRCDAVLTQDLVLEQIDTNKFTIVSSLHTRPDVFHNRDWDFLWMGSREAIQMWMLPHLAPRWHQISNKVFSVSEIDYMNSRHGLGGTLTQRDASQNWRHYLYRVVMALDSADIGFTTLDARGIFSELVAA